MFYREIYEVEWRRLIAQLTPVRLRNAKLTALLIALLSPVMYVYSTFINYKLQVAYQLSITPQVVFLEKFLNDHYDYDLRRIKISDPFFYDTAELYLEIEGKNLVMYNEGEAVATDAFFTEAESSALGVDFIVKIPASLHGYATRITAQINNLKLPTKKFAILNI